MILSVDSTIQTNGSGQSGNNKQGYDAGSIIIASGGTLNASGSIQAIGGDSKATGQGAVVGGNGGTVEIYQNPITADVPLVINNGGAGSPAGSPGNDGILENIQSPDYLAIPEPSSSLMIAIGSLFFFSRRRRLV